jgi:DNA polymerase III subunit beta
VRIASKRDDLAAALAIAARGASTKSTLPVLSHVLLRAHPDHVELSSTDMEISLRLRVEATVEESGDIVLPRLAADIVRSLAPGMVQLEHRENEASLMLTSGSSSFKLNALQASDFPQLPEVSGERILLPAERFISSVERVARAASRDDTRPVLTGVLMRVEPGSLTMVATDSYRLALRVAPLESAPPDGRSALIPARALQEVSRLAQSTKAEEVELLLGDQLAAFRVGGVEVMSRLIDGQFPDYRQLIPERAEQEVRFDRGELLSVLGRIGVLAPRGTPISLQFTQGQVTVMAMSEETIPVAFSGEDLEIRFNAEFLRDGVDATDGDEVRMGLISSMRPGIIRGAGDEFTYLLMPIRKNA